MSENENVSGTTGNAGGTGGGAGNGWGWEPVPHGGEYDSEATAFVKLPQDMLDALDNGEPLAAPGHGYVPPPMIVPLGSASTDPTATGTWTMPVQWPEAEAAPAAAAPARGPIPASIPLPPSVAASFGEPGGPSVAGGDAESGSTAEWRFPEAAHQPEHRSDERVATGQWTLPTGGEPVPGAGEFPGGGVGGGAAAADWSQAPATLPGGAAAPWAQPGALDGLGAGAGATGAETLMTSGVLPGEGPQTGALGRGPRVLGGPGVGTPLPDTFPQPGPEPEGVPHAAPDIDAAHGPAQAPVEEQRPRPVVDAESAGAPCDGHDAGQGHEAGQGAGHGSGQGAGHGPGLGHDAGHGGGAGYGSGAGHDAGRGSGPGLGHDAGHGSGAGYGNGAGHDPEHGSGPGLGHDAGHGHDAEHGSGHGHGFAESAHAVGEGPAGPVAEAGAGPVPGGEGADSGVTPPDEGGAGGFPVQEATYEEEAVPAVAHHEHPAASYVLRVNGADRPVTGAWIGESLLYVLRERLGLVAPRTAARRASAALARCRSTGGSSPPAWSRRRPRRAARCGPWKVSRPTGNCRTFKRRCAGRAGCSAGSACPAWP